MMKRSATTKALRVAAEGGLPRLLGPSRYKEYERTRTVPRSVLDAPSDTNLYRAAAGLFPSSIPSIRTERRR